MCDGCTFGGLKDQKIHCTIVPLQFRMASKDLSFIPSFIRPFIHLLVSHTHELVDFVTETRGMSLINPSSRTRCRRCADHLANFARASTSPNVKDSIFFKITVCACRSILDEKICKCVQIHRLGLFKLCANFLCSSNANSHKLQY